MVTYNRYVTLAYEECATLTCVGCATLPYMGWATLTWEICNFNLKIVYTIFYKNHAVFYIMNTQHYNCVIDDVTFI